MGDVMDEIREEARRRGEDREQKEAMLRQEQAKLLDLDRKPERSKPPQASSSSSAAPPRSAAAPANSAGGGAAGAGAGGAVGSSAEGDSTTLVESSEITLPLCGCGMTNEPLGSQLFSMAGMRPPAEATFQRYFKNWFEEDYFPNMSQKLQKELVSRAKTKGFFSGLSSQVKKWAMANTDVRLQAEVWFAYFWQHNPPQFSTYGFLRVAFVNLGSVAHPCWTKFLGYRNSEGDQWMLTPFASVEPDISAIMDELDGRGGMAALLSSS